MTALTHCAHGHEYTPENTGVNNRGWVYCRVCSRIKTQRYKDQNPEAVKAQKKRYAPIWKEKNKPKMRVKTRAAGSKAVLHYSDGAAAERVKILDFINNRAEHAEAASGILSALVELLQETPT